jgi:hypothetical protein
MATHTEGPRLGDGVSIEWLVLLAEFGVPGVTTTEPGSPPKRTLPRAVLEALSRRAKGVDDGVQEKAG